MNENNLILAEFVRIFHIFIIIFVLIAPISCIPSILILHISFCISLLIHWYCNQDICSLSVIESKLRGIDYTESFTHQFISPVYTVSQTNWSRICYFVTICLLFLSFYLLYNSKIWFEIREYKQKIDECANNNKDLSFSEKCYMYFDCYKMLFTI